MPPGASMSTDRKVRLASEGAFPDRVVLYRHKHRDLLANDSVRMQQVHNIQTAQAKRTFRDVFGVREKNKNVQRAVDTTLWLLAWKVHLAPEERLLEVHAEFEAARKKAFVAAEKGASLSVLMLEYRCFLTSPPDSVVNELAR